MDSIILTDDELKILEKRFGPNVRKMGPWISDGIFGYTSVSMAVLEEAAETMGNSNLMATLGLLIDAPERTEAFIHLLETSGCSLIQRVVDVYRERTLGAIPGDLCSRTPPEEERKSKAAAA
jgi:hypothetical protein